MLGTSFKPSERILSNKMLGCLLEVETSKAWLKAQILIIIIKRTWASIKLVGSERSISRMKTFMSRTKTMTSQQ
jgi:hypothetical protein